MGIALKRRRFTVAEYHRMGEAGIFAEDDRVELIAGEVVEMTPIGPRHAATVDRIVHLFISRLGDRATVRGQHPVPLPRQDSELEPDVALVLPRTDFYATAHPRPDEVLLVVEVMDSSVGRDRRVKLPIYARDAVREVWLVHLDDVAVEVHRRPQGSRYADNARFSRGQSLTIEAFPDVAFQVDDLIG